MSDGEVYDEEAQRAVEAICKERDELKARVAELERRNAATVKFTSEEIECIKMSSLLALRVLDDYCDEHPGVANKRTDLINGIIAKCDAILKGAAFE